MLEVKDKKILISGGTGTVGQALTRRLLREEAAVVRILSRDEFKQYQMEEALLQQDLRKNVRFLLGDVRDKDRLMRAMEDIDYVFHLAALKHVPACEYNPYEAVKTNVLGTQNIIESAIQQGVQAVLYTSSDKAAAPTNTMGASKLLAERLVIAANQYRGARLTKFLSVRFGNILSSRGSVIPLFERQVKSGGPITLTNGAMTRFFMQVDQAVELIVQAMQESKGGETFVLKMPVFKLDTLAEAVMQEMGIRVPVQTIGLRPGEKMYEELVSDEEASHALETEKWFIVLPYFQTIEEGLRNYPDAWQAAGKIYSSAAEPLLKIEQVREQIRPQIAKIREEF